MSEPDTATAGCQHATAVLTLALDGDVEALSTYLNGLAPDELRCALVALAGMTMTLLAEIGDPATIVQDFALALVTP